MSDDCKRITAAPVWVPLVADGKHVIRGEFVLVDGIIGEVVAWNDLPTFYVRLRNQKQLKEVEPWRIKKIEKYPES